MAKPAAEYTVVARRYRPRQFDDLIGQEAVSRALKNALTSGRVAHAYLFTGARGVGKTSTARILAKALNCEQGPTPHPCEQCTSCQAIAAGDDIDVREIDGASNRGIDDVRAIRQDVSTRPTRSRFKIYIIDEVHMLTKESFNALLKTLEEPPPHVKFIFATTEVNKLPVTILSRCQRFDFGNISTERIAAQLQAIVASEKRKADAEALEIIARRAGGSMRDAQSLLDQLLAFSGDNLSAETVQQLLGVAGPERVFSLAEAIVKRDAGLALQRLQDFTDDGLPVGDLLDQLIEHWRDLMLAATAGKEAKNLNTPVRYRDGLMQQAQALSLDTILAGLDLLMSAKMRQRGSNHGQTLVQMAIIRLCRLEDLTPLAQLAHWFNQPGSSGGSSGGLSPTRSATVPSQPTQAPPEGKKKAVPPNQPAGNELTTESLPVIWPQILAQVGAILGGQLQRAGLPAISGPKLLVLTFASEYNAAYDHCALASNVQRVEHALRMRTGQEWQVRLERTPTAVGVGGLIGNVSPDASAPTRVRPQEVMQRFPILQRAFEIFDALPVFVDPDFGSTAVPQPTDPVIEPPDDEGT